MSSMLQKLLTFKIKRDGTIKFIYDDDVFETLKVLGPSSIRRASHVEPIPNTNGLWYSDMSPVDGPELGPFLSRDEALKAEREWIETNVLGKKSET